MPLDQTPNSWQPSVCPHDCPSTCALDVEVLDERRIGKVRGAKANAYTDGVICAKVARYAERIHHPERLLYPLRRTSEKGASQPEFKRISWEEALDQTAEALLKAEQRYGSETVWPYFYAGTMGHVQRDGIERLRHVKRYSRQWSTICTTLAESGWFAGVGRKAGVDAREVAESELIVVWGGNPVSTQVNLMNWIAKARKARGAKLVVIDPYRTPTAEQADLHLMVQPGSDAALAAAVAHVLIEEKLIDRDYLARLTDWSPEIEAHYMTTTPDWAAPITGLSEEAIRSFARLYGSTKKSYIRVGYGFARARHGAASVHAVSCLPSLTGAWTVKGGGALWGNGWIYRLNKTLIDGADRLDPSVRVLDQSRFGPVMTGDKRDLGEGPPITALLIQNTNPAVVCPETTKCIQGLMRPDLFTVVHEQFLTDTAQLADIVLPATMFLEHDDYYTASGHTHLQVARKLVEAPGECRSNHDVICQLAKRLGASHPGFDMTAWEIVEATFKVSGYASPDEALRKRGLDCAEPFEKAHFLEGFPQPDGRFHFRADWARIGKDVAGLSPLPGLTDLSDRAAADRPFRLVAAPARSYLNSTFTETPGSQKREGRPELLIHPSALARLGLAEGQLARIGNELGSLVLHLRPFDGVQENVVVVESIWPNSAFVEGRGINTLVSAEAGKPRGGAVFHDTAIWVRAA